MGYNTRVSGEASGELVVMYKMCTVVVVWCRLTL